MALGSLQGQKDEQSRQEEETGTQEEGRFQTPEMLTFILGLGDNPGPRGMLGGS